MDPLKNLTKAVQEVAKELKRLSDQMEDLLSHLEQEALENEQARDDIE